MENKKIIVEALKKLKEKKDSVSIGDNIHLPDLIMKKDDLLKYLKEYYNIELKD